MSVLRFLAGYQRVGM
jgi:tetratricopeptide (TPR) repeat protein